MSQTLELTDDEFRTLALAVYLGERMANIGSKPGKETYPAMTALLQKIYARTDEDAAETYADKIIANYDEDTMFEELAHELALRDIHERIDHAASPSPDDVQNRAKLERQRTQWYQREFDEHGLGHVIIDAGRPIPCEDN